MSTPREIMKSPAYRYAEDVLGDKVMAPKTIKKQAGHFLDDLKRAEAGWKYAFDLDAGRLPVQFCEQFLLPTAGAFSFSKSSGLQVLGVHGAPHVWSVLGRISLSCEYAARPTALMPTSRLRSTRDRNPCNGTPCRSGIWFLRRMRGSSWDDSTRRRRKPARSARR